MPDFELLRLKEPKSGWPLIKFIDRNIYGRCTMPEIDSSFLITIAIRCPGDHFEVGVAHGGSSILVAYCKQMYNIEGHVYGVDVFGGYKYDPSHHLPPPSLLYAQNNIILHGLQDRVTLFQAVHPPVPPELDGKQFVSAFIDGGHSYDQVKDDWLELKDRVYGVILFHDINNVSFGCFQVFKEACDDPDWEFLAQGGKMGLVKRNDYKIPVYED